MKFRSLFEPDQLDHSSSCGETTRPVFTLVNRNGERSLKQVDTIDLVESINSYEGECNIKAMLRKFSLTGDPSIFNQRGGNYVYEDVSECEADLARLITASREIALLKLQNSSVQQDVSEDSGAGADAVADAGADLGNGGTVNE